MKIHDFILLLFLLLTKLHLVQGQVPNYQVYNYTVDDGLPSNECHDVVQDSIGYIWIATDRGLVRWDGYDFKVYGPEQGLNDISCIELYMDSKGHIWINTIGRDIYKYIPPQDTIVPYEFNAVFDSIDAYMPIYKKMTVSDQGDVTVSDNDKEMFTISNRGELRKWTFDEHPIQTKITNVSGELFINDIALFDWKSDSSYLDFESYKTHKIVFKERVYDGCHSDDWRKNVLHRVFALDDEQFVFSIRGINYFFSGDSLMACIPIAIGYSDIVPDKNGGYFASHDWLGGVKHFSSIERLMKDSSTVLVDSISAVRLLLDKKDNLWISTLSRGILYLKKSDVEQVGDGRITDMVRCGRDFYTLENRNIFKKYDWEFNDSLIDQFDLEKSGLEFNKVDNYILITGFNSQYYEIDERRMIETPLRGNIKGALSVVNGGALIWGNHYLYYWPSLSMSSESTFHLTLPNVRITDLAGSPDDGIYVGATDGIYFVEDSSYSKIGFGGPMDNTRVSGVIEDERGLILATAGRGMVWWDGSRVTSIINEAQGLISNYIESIVIMDATKLIATSKRGLSILEQKVPNGAYAVIKNYDIRHGLPSNEISQVVTMGDSIIVATSKGIGIITDVVSMSQRVSPLIEAVTVNGTLRSREGSMSFSYSENEVVIHFKVVDFTQHGQIRYRHRLNGAAWSVTGNTSVSFGALQPDNYIFELQGQNVDGVWSDSILIAFMIRPPWWRTYWFYCLSYTFLLLIGYYLYKLRINSIIKASNVKEELRQLEMSALQAQMNPHFIFNCLNSIQPFIMSNDKNSAMSYLSKFAKLVRQTLNASAEKSLTLETEIDMLENYLSLEQLRHKNKFTYTITMEEGIDQISTRIPPLLIQPFVENAVLHGMKGVEKGGEIEICFSQSIDGLIIKVRDNGKGMTERGKTAIHRSMGTAITDRRLALLNLQESGGLTIEPLNSEKGTVVQLILRNI